MINDLRILISTVIPVPLLPVFASLNPISPLQSIDQLHPNPI